jgi:hypothetical protein
MQVTFTLSQGQVYSHTIALTIYNDTNQTFGMILGGIVHKFFRSTMAIRKCGNKGFSFNHAFDFTLNVNGKTLCDTIDCEEILVSKCRMSNKLDGQKRFTRLLANMLYTSLADDEFKNQFYGDVMDVFYNGDSLDAEVRQFLDTKFMEFVD